MGHEAQYPPGVCTGRVTLAATIGTIAVLVDGLSAILTGVGDYVAEPEHDDGSNPKNVDGETDEASQEGDRKDCHHHDIRHPALTEQRANASSLR
jgi:hypothetical protein